MFMPKITSPPVNLQFRAYLGVDPGATGGMTVIGSDGRPKKFLAFGNSTDHSVAEWLEKVTRVFELKAALENVHSMPKQGVASSFAFGKSAGLVRGFLVAFKIPFIEVTPQVWQKQFGIPPRKDKTKTEHKKILQAKAHQLFPDYVEEISRSIADSVLIAEWLRIQEMRANAS